MRWAGDVEHMGQERAPYKFGDNIKVTLLETNAIECVCVCVCVCVCGQFISE
jgi:hypothetical protein